MNADFVSTRTPRPMWAVVHVFDPSYSGDGRTCLCGLPKDDDIHATPVALGASELTVGRRRL